MADTTDKGKEFDPEETPVGGDDVVYTTPISGNGPGDPQDDDPFDEDDET